MRDATPPQSSLFVDQLAHIVSEPSKPLLELAQAKLGLSKQKAAIFPQRSVLPAGFWSRVAHPPFSPSTATTSLSVDKEYDVIVPQPAEESFVKPESARMPMVLSYHSDTESSYVESDAAFPELPEPEQDVELDQTDEAVVEDSFAQFVDAPSDPKAEVERLTKQNEFLVLMLRKVTAKIVLNRQDMAAYKARIAQLETPPPKIITSEIATQTDDDETESNPSDTQKIDTLTWQLKIAHAKIDALAANLHQERARLEVAVAESAACAAQFDLEAAQWNARFAAHEGEMKVQQVALLRYEHIHAVMQDYFKGMGIEIENTMDANAVAATIHSKPLRQSDVNQVDAIFNHVTESMARELAFLAELNKLDPTNTAACDQLYQRSCKKQAKKPSVRNA